MLMGQCDSSVSKPKAIERRHAARTLGEFCYGTMSYFDLAFPVSIRVTNTTD
ncbi:MAG: hypothetical protein JWN70_1361 [Planctomycetaceae bacterium]|nr:hypothetical protein [Planctomycetaceae bacterium]